MRTSALVLLALAAGCRPAPRAETETLGGASAPAAPGGLSAADEAALRAADQGWAKAASAGDAAALTAFYTDDAVLMPPGSPALHGGGEIGKYFAGMTGAVSGPFELTTTAVEGRGDLALTSGTYSARLTPRQAGAKPLPPERGKYLGVMKKQSDGSWKLVYDIWNTDAAPNQ
jgi:ketosteroid isomerase-like protein